MENEPKTFTGLARELKNLPTDKKRVALEMSASLAAVSLRVSRAFVEATPDATKFLNADNLRAWAEMGRKLAMANVDAGVNFFVEGIESFRHVPIKARRLVEVTYEAMMRGIEQARPGNRLGDVAHAIQSFAEKHRYGVVREFCGHGLGRLFHDAPEVVHAGRPGTGPELKPGMFFTIEPMVNIGRPDCKVLEDGWTAVTRDRSLSAQFEHSVGITETGCEIFTKSPAGLDAPPYAA